MKECQKWWNSNQDDVAFKKELARFGEITTQEQALDALVEVTWRAALLWFYKVAEHLSPSDCALIDGELKDDS